MCVERERDRDRQREEEREGDKDNLKNRRLAEQKQITKQKIEYPQHRFVL